MLHGRLNATLRETINTQRYINERIKHFYSSHKLLLEFHHIPKNRGIYSQIEVSNIIMAIKWMQYMGMIKHLFKSTTIVKEIQKDEYK
jgi:hypothetical protein